MTAPFAEGAFDLEEEAPAKINLALHVTGQRPDGYHCLDMLVTFVSEGDRIFLRASDEDGFTLSGRFSSLLSADAAAGSNLVLAARDRLRQAASEAGQEAPPVHIHLEKNLPIASGIGGGSADAAATLRGLMRLWALRLPQPHIATLALSLGADVPMCLSSRPLIARGVGEVIEPVADLPAFAMVLGNPLTGVSTPAVFRQLTNKTNPPFDSTTAGPRRPSQWLDLIGGLRNDLEPPARALCGDIATLSQMLDDSGATLVRMSGSGATCFGLYDSMEAAREAAASLHSARPDWYFKATETLAGDR